jgi:hypothetical protein
LWEGKVVEWDWVSGLWGTPKLINFQEDDRAVRKISLFLLYVIQISTLYVVSYDFMSSFSFLNLVRDIYFYYS